MVFFRSPPIVVYGQQTGWHNAYIGETPPSLEGKPGVTRRLRDSAAYGSYFIDEYKTIADDPTVPGGPVDPPPPPDDRTWLTQTSISGTPVGPATEDLFANQLPGGARFIAIINGVRNGDIDLIRQGLIDWDGQWIAQPPVGTSALRSDNFLNTAGFPPDLQVQLNAYLQGRRYLITWDELVAHSGNDQCIGLQNPKGTVDYTTLGQPRAFIYHVAATVTGNHAPQLQFVPGAGKDITKIDLKSFDIRECDAAGNPLTAGQAGLPFLDKFAKNYDVARCMDYLGGSSQFARAPEELASTSSVGWGGGGYGNFGRKGGVPYEDLLRFFYEECGGMATWVCLPMNIGAPSRVDYIDNPPSQEGDSQVLTFDLRGPHIVPGSFLVLESLDGAGADLDLDVDGAGTHTATVKDKSYAYKYQYEDIHDGVVEAHIAISTTSTGSRRSFIDARRQAFLNGALILGTDWRNPALAPAFYARWAAHIVSSLIASGVPSWLPFFIELANEIWNFANEPFGQNSNHFLGLGDFTGGGGFSVAAGAVMAKLMHAVEIEQALQGVSYNIQWVIAGQTANPQIIGNRMATVRDYYQINELDWESCKVAGAITGYSGNAVFGRANYGLYQTPVVTTPEAANETHRNFYKAQIAADPAGFALAHYNALVDPDNLSVRGVAYIKQRMEATHSLLAALGKKLNYMYEGSSHAAIPSFMRRADNLDADIVDWWRTYFGGGGYGALIDRTVNDMIIAFAGENGIDDYMIADFGGLGGFNPAYPWQRDFHFNPENPHDAVWEDYGRHAVLEDA